MVKIPLRLQGIDLRDLAAYDRIPTPGLEGLFWCADGPVSMVVVFGDSRDEAFSAAVATARDIAVQMPGVSVSGVYDDRVTMPDQGDLEYLDDESAAVLNVALTALSVTADRMHTALGQLETQLARRAAGGSEVSVEALRLNDAETGWTEAGIFIVRDGYDDDDVLAMELLTASPAELRAVYDGLALYFEQGIWSTRRVQGG